MDRYNVMVTTKILDDYGIFRKPKQVIDFFENPWMWEGEMEKVVERIKEEISDEVVSIGKTFAIRETKRNGKDLRT